MKTILIWNNKFSDRQVAEIAGSIDQGSMVILPTDTIYAICCDALNVKAVESLCRLKGIQPKKNNLSILCANISMASHYAKIDNVGYEWLKNYTPGAYTFLFRALSSLPSTFKGRKIIGVRIPDSPIALAVSNYLNKPLLVTSIKFEEYDYGVNPDLIAERYDGKVDMMVVNGEGVTVPSTIIDCTVNPPEIVREGKGEI